MVIVNADDFGYDGSTNRAVAECFREGLCTSATVMTNMPGFEEAAAIAAERGFCDAVGLHLVLNEGRPLSEEIRSCRRFCTEDGRLALSRDFPTFFLHPSEARALAGEVRAQILACRTRGLRISHADSHHHVHTEWGIAKVLFPVLREEKIPFLRIARNTAARQLPHAVLYKALYNASLGRRGLRGTDFFGSVEQYLRVRERGTAAGKTFEVMIHPRFVADRLSVGPSMDIEEYRATFRRYLASETLVSYNDLRPAGRAA